MTKSVIWCTILFIALEGFILWKSKANAGVSISTVKTVYKRLCLVNKRCPKLILINSAEVDAETTGNGIIVYTGLLKFLDNKDEIALVLGHELGHYSKGDAHKMESYQMEYNADYYGANLMVKAGFNLCRGLGFFRKTIKLFGDYTSPDHPMTSLRINRLKGACK